jgi:hypothetical protein
VYYSIERNQFNKLNLDYYNVPLGIVKYFFVTNEPNEKEYSGHPNFRVICRHCLKSAMEIADRAMDQDNLLL